MKSLSFGMRTFPPRGASLAALATAAAIALCARTPSHAATLLLTVRYPSEGASIGAVDKSFTFGATAPGASVTVNGIPASVAPDGGWIAFVPFSSGDFVLHVRARLGDAVARVDRGVTVSDGASAPFPTQATIVQPGDPLGLTIGAARASAVSANGPGFSDVALTPDPTAPSGTFGANITAPRRAAGPSHVIYHVGGRGGSTVDVASAGMLEIASRAILFDGTVIPYTPDPESGARPYGMIAGPDGFTDFTVPLGTRLAIVGRNGNLLEVALPGAAPEWIDRREVTPIAGAHAPVAATIVAFGQTENASETDVSITLAGARVPFRVLEGPAGADGIIRLYGADTGSTRYADVPFSLRQHAFWGYRSRWSGDELIVSFRRPPSFSGPPLPALRGLKIVVDPGHAPDSGAIGPVGTQESDVNLDIASRLAEKLRASGAIVIMTRTTNDGVRLYDRPALAERLNATVLISVHNNAPPDGIDPSDARGYTIYYFNAQSKALALAIHDEYGRVRDLQDDGVHVGDFALVRTSQMPAVLTESAFITWPWEEMKLRDPSFRDRLASAMTSGMERWAEKMRALETKPR
jgi:N-acetylmuramoyl-L-alanine amidase